MGSKSDQTTTSEAAPWGGQQPYLQDIFRESQNQYYAGGPQYFPGQTVAPFSPQQQMAMGMTTQRALGGDPSQQAMGNWLTGQLGQQNVDPRQIQAGAMGAMGGIPQAQQMLGQTGQQAQQIAGVGGDMTMPQAAQFAGGAIGPYAQQLQGMTGYGTLGEAGQFFDQPGALPAALPGAAAQLGATAGGQYLGSNPYLDQLYETGAGRIQEQFEEDVLPAIAGQFGAAGRTGSGAQALMQGRAAGDVAGELAGLYGDIYSPAYEAERTRQLQGAQQLGQLGLGAGELGLGQRQAAGNLYTGERQLGQEAAQQAGQLGLGGGQLAADLYGTGMQGDIQRRQLAGELSLGAGQQLGQLGLGGLEQLGGLYGDIGQQQFRAGTLAPQYAGMQYGDIDRLMGVGGMTQDQAQQLISGDKARWDYMQNQPMANLGAYANLIQGLPAGYGTTSETTPGGSRFAGAAGGALAGAATGNPWLALGGGLLGAIA
jgi:hypothetical protein